MACAIIERSSSPGTPQFRLFYVAGNGNLTLNDLTLAGGQAYQGGAVYNRGIVELNDSTVRANAADLQGGGLYNEFVR